MNLPKDLILNSFPSTSGNQTKSLSLLKLNKYLKNPSEKPNNMKKNEQRKDYFDIDVRKRKLNIKS